MNEDTAVPDLSGYITVKEAAEILGLSARAVYEFVDEERLPSLRAGHAVLVLREAVERFERQPVGKPRKTIPPWRISSGENTQFMTLIHVSIQAGKREELAQKLEAMRQQKLHLFPGTVVRSIMASETKAGQAVIVLIWRGAIMPPETKREEALAAFRQDLEDVLDWERAEYNSGPVMMHT
ncbi:DNA-binding protein [Ktedonosporobacter rubrisoli]|uniref:DNA-binding protein n=1 Tax=Ktedonosporobacter rubrisoli TaxID=2509675 RepID=A0A4V0YZE4_KTERU|nr:helix-turn-helix domain-containing protein [Ktedonosporobacter rubrisoli]QBD79431.1 DNA-binding protein [Ktedonosporobacter rubrisoli]